MNTLVERSRVEHLASLNKRSLRRFGTLDFGNTLQSRSNEDEEDDDEDDEEDDEDCDDESESDSNTSTTSPTSSNTAQNTSVPSYTVASPKKVPSWTKSNEVKNTTPAPKKTEPTANVSDTSVPAYTVSSPKKVPSWKKSNEDKNTTPSYTAPKKTEETPVKASAEVSVSTGSGSSSSYTGTSAGVTTYSGKATFFSQGGVAGACGTVHQDSDYVVAIDASMYEGGKFCGKTIAVTRVSTGKTIHCVGADECPECPSVHSLDLSIAAFNALGNPDEGVFDIKWEVVS